MKNSSPDFLIIGAAKAGTTSLHNYLDEHDNIKMSGIKEPKFLTYEAGIKNFTGKGDKEVENKIIKDLASYKALFETNKQHFLTGESSADTLFYYDKTIPIIKRIADNPKIIILLRNPVDRAFSAYTHLVRDKREEHTFEKALELEEERIKKNYEFIWYYKSCGMYFKQVNAFLNQFDNVKIILFEDLKTKPNEILNEVFGFLNVENLEVNTNKVYNKSGVPKANWKSYIFDNFVSKDNFLKKGIRGFIPESFRNKIYKKMKYEFLNNNLERQEMNPETRHNLKKYYFEDINNLQILINQDLTTWIK